MTLPFPPRKALLRSVWIGVNLVGMLISGAVVLAFAGPVRLALTAGLFLVLTVLGLRLRGLHFRLYRMWNWIAARVRKAGFRWTLYVSHHLFLRAVGPTGSKFDARIDPSLSTGWTPYAEVYDDSRSGGRSGPIVEVARSGWTRQYTEWARSSGNLWALMLLPFLVLMAFFREDQGNGGGPSNIYTLF